MSAKKPPAKTTFESASGPLPALRPVAARLDPAAAPPDEPEAVDAAGGAVRQCAGRDVILRLVETVKGL